MISGNSEPRPDALPGFIEQYRGRAGPTQRTGGPVNKIADAFRRIFGRQKATPPTPEPLKAQRPPVVSPLAMKLAAAPKRGRTNHSNRPHTSRAARFCRSVPTLAADLAKGKKQA